MEKIRAKHRLDLEQDIITISMRLGNRVYNVDLDKRRDWRYISGVIKRGGVRAEMIVSTSKLPMGQIGME